MTKRFRLPPLKEVGHFILNFLIQSGFWWVPVGALFGAVAAVWSDVAALGDQPVLSVAAVLGGLLMGYLVAAFKRRNQFWYGIVELAVAAFAVLVSAARLAHTWSEAPARWPSLATLLGAIYISSRAFENIRAGHEKAKASTSGV